jgi:hypothetical protein
MDKKELFNTLGVNFLSMRSVLMGGNHGIGKSAVVKYFSQQIMPGLVKELFNEEPEEVGFVDIRLSQNDVGDLKGIPYRINGTTFFAPPNWFPVHPEDSARMTKWLDSVDETFNSLSDQKYGVLFLDELNRASREVLQCAFELVLDRRLNGIRIPDTWLVVAAINDNQEIYQVEQMDPALANRFHNIQFRPSAEDWFEWARPEVDAGRMHGAVLDYLVSHDTKLDPSDEEIFKASEADDTSVALFTRRSWTDFARFLQKWKEWKGSDLTDLSTPDEERYLADSATGYLGSSQAVAFIGWLKTEYKTLSPKEILYHMHEKGNKSKSHLVKTVKKNRMSEITGLSAGLMDELKKIKGKKVNDDVAGNLCTYIEIIPSEAVQGFFANFMKEVPELADYIYCWNEKRPGKNKTKDNGQPLAPFKMRVYTCSSKKKALEAAANS